MSHHPDLATAPSIPRLLALQAGRHADAIAIAAPGRAPLTYRRLRDQVEDLVARLNALGMGRNDRVGIVLPNGPEMAVAFLGVASAATAAPLNPTYRREEFDFYLSDLGAQALIVTTGSDSPALAAAETLGIPILELFSTPESEAGLLTLAGSPGATPAALSGPAEPDDVALVLHTSGTTSRPKMVPLTHENLCTSAANVSATLGLGPADRCLNVMPLFHIHGLVTAVLASLASGASVICTPGFYAPEFFSWMDECEPSWYTAVPTMHQSILARAGKHQDVVQRRRLRFVRSSSSALPPQVMAQLEETFGAPVIEAYGMTEAAHQMASNPLPPRPRKPGSVGLAAGPEIAIMGPGGALLPPGQQGEVVIRGRSVTRGYENNPDANEAAFTHGWFRTGDQGCLDEDGYLTLTGRLKEIINRGGEKVSPREVDEVLLDHPAVAQVVTFAIPEPTLGEDVGAAVVLQTGMAVSERELREFAAGRLADFKVPRTVLFLSEIPKGPTGKLQRIGLAERLGLGGPRPERSPTHAFVAPRTPVEELVARLWAEVLRLERVGVDDHFLDLGGDSMLATRLVSRIRQDLRLELSLRSLFDAPTVAQQAELLLELLLHESEKPAVASELNIP
ncbi:MAG TPA: AMP-binding protein [Gemmatimonadales bacterium]|jgi:acyl-CoA synthetase (AMP-forming)/AMP-acid ligase II/acyl carrier protein